MSSASPHVQDAWSNAALGHGQRYDPLAPGQTYWSGRARRAAAELDSVYTLNGLVRKIVDTPVDDELKQWIVHKGLEGEDAKAVEDEVKRLKLKTVMAKGRRWARLYGGAGAIVRIEGDRDLLHEPLDYRKTRRIQRFEVADCHDLQPSGTSHMQADGQAPEFYRWTTIWGSNYTVHHSRVIRFEGLPVPRRVAADYNGWGASVVDLVWEALERVGLTDQGLGRLASEWHKVTMQVPNLLDQISQQGVAEISSRYAVLRSMQSILNMTVSGNGEVLGQLTASATGLADIVDQLRATLSAVSNIPVVRLWGISPGGLNATGDADLQFYYDACEGNQLTYDEDPLDALLELMFAGQIWGRTRAPIPNPFRGQVPEGWSWAFAPIERLTALQLADLRAKTAAADASDCQNGILDPDEVAISRYGSGTYSTETTLLHDRFLAAAPASAPAPPSAETSENSDQPATPRG